MEKYNRWLVVDKAGKDKWGSNLVKCVCDCGNEGIVRFSDLKNNTTIQCRPCGYKYKRNVPRLKSPLANKGNNYKHGKLGTTTYSSWCSMIFRCNDVKGKNYRWYKARNISVCDRWKDFTNFLSDMGERPSGLMLDRIDNDKGYFKENCRWVTPKVSSNNRRCVRVQCV